jgi:hypothetical protein
MNQKPPQDDPVDKPSSMPARDNPRFDQALLDESLAETLPASDPISPAADPATPTSTPNPDRGAKEAWRECQSPFKWVATLALLRGDGGALRRARLLGTRVSEMLHGRTFDVATSDAVADGWPGADKRRQERGRANVRAKQRESEDPVRNRLAPPAIPNTLIASDACAIAKAAQRRGNRAHRDHAAKRSGGEGSCRRSRRVARGAGGRSQR